jgi:hypothetical protein
MATRKKAPTARFVPTNEHFITIGGAQEIISGATFNVYGRLISGVTLPAAQAGLVDPRSSDEELQLALIFGTQENGICTKLDPPQKVYMPVPDGPADGCDWDPKQFVVWRNLSKTWMTLHVQSNVKTLAAALTPLDKAVPALASIGTQDVPYLRDVLYLQWMEFDTAANIDPSFTLAAVWQIKHTGDYTPSVQGRLSNVIYAAYNRNYPGSAFPATMTVQTLANNVGAIVNP